MNWRDLPVSETLAEIRNEPDVRKAWNNILGFGKQNLSSLIWDNCRTLSLAQDIFNTTHWMQNAVGSFPLTKGIYLGLDTLNMDKGRGHNVEVGFSFTCNPLELDDEWSYQCDYYPDPFLIEGLYHFSEIISGKKKWGKEEREFTEYLVFLGYSGLVLREALLKLNTPGNLLSVWGFHDGDMFYLLQKIGDKRVVVAREGK
jgi:hypothetical protein